MAKLNGPLFSLKASGKLNKQLTYKTRNGRAHVGKYTDRGIKNITEPSMSQVDKRNLYTLILICWQNKDTAGKKVFNDLVKAKNLPMSGFNYFVKLATADPYTFLSLNLFYSFNQIVDNKIPDLSGGGNHMSLFPSYPSNSPTLTLNTNIKQGKCINFDGVNDYSKVAQSARVKPPYFTICFWFNPKAFPTVSMVFTSRPQFNRGWANILFTSTSINYDTYINNTEYRFTMNNLFPNLNKYYFITAICNATKKELQINGVVKSSSAVGKGPCDYSTTDLFFGTSSISLGSYLQATLDNFIMFSRTPSQNELNAIMKATDPRK